MHVDSVFIDTNVLLYAHDSRDVRKEKISKAWLEMLVEKQVALTNLQVLNELTAVLLRKNSFATVDEALAIADLYAELGDSPITARDSACARSLHRRFGYSWWDCILLASALDLGCSHFLSEDLQDGQVVDGLTIVDPFRHEPGTFFQPVA